MRIFALGVFVVVGLGLGACSTKAPKVQVVDSATTTDASDTCNVLTQTGCAATERCTWVQDDASAPPLGHIACVPDNGTVATGGDCVYGPPGALGFDNCVKGDVCNYNKCKVICDLGGGAPTCGSNFLCQPHDGLFGPHLQPVVAAVCDAKCDPLTDNAPLGSAGPPKTGTNCPSLGSQEQGCYGGTKMSGQTVFSCAREFNTDLVHRSACTTANNCVNFSNGCSQGYIPLLYDAFGSMQVDCIAFCKPADCYPGTGHCGTNPGDNLQGSKVAPTRRCNNTDLRSATAIDSASETNNGEQCMYSWRFQFDTTGMFVPSTTGDTVGYCYDHKLYKWDSNGDGMVTATDTEWLRCDDGPGFAATVGGGANPVTDFGSAAGQAGAANFGCVATTTGHVSFAGKPLAHQLLVEMPRLLYGAMQ